MFFYKERKRTQRSERSFEKNGCPTLVEYTSCLLPEWCPELESGLSTPEVGGCVNEDVVSFLAETMDCYLL